jgi:hypothetical protein
MSGRARTATGAGLAEEAHGHVVVATAAMLRKRHLVRPITIAHALLSFAFAVDHASTP